VSEVTYLSTPRTFIAGPSTTLMPHTPENSIRKDVRI
jgi:hypothetical protein